MGRRQDREMLAAIAELVQRLNNGIVIDHRDFNVPFQITLTMK